MTSPAIALAVDLPFPDRMAPSVCPRPHRVDARSPHAGHLSLPFSSACRKGSPPSWCDDMLSDQYCLSSAKT